MDGYQEALKRIEANKRTKAPFLDLGGLGIPNIPIEVFDCTWIKYLSLQNLYITIKEEDESIFPRPEKFRSPDSIEQSIQEYARLLAEYFEETKTKEETPVEKITELSIEIAKLNNLLSLQGITYEWNDTVTGNKRPTGIQYGFTAQNIQAVFPTPVEEDNLGYLQTAYGTYDAMTVEAICALNDKITTLEEENEAQQTEINQLKAQNARIQQIEQQMAQLLSQSGEDNGATANTSEEK